MGRADRIARESLDAERRSAAEDAKQAASQARADAAAELETIRSLSQEASEGESR